ncbi:MAG: nucleotidyltransferase domain-containing protein [Gemmatimonas sp.]
MAKGSSMTLDHLVAELSRVYAEGLRSIVLYGSAASGEQVEGRSDYNVLVIVDRIDRNRLQQLSDTSRSWIHAGNPLPLTLTQAEWARSADIFPMEYSDILERHRVLKGENPFAEIRVAPGDLRLQVEHEAMGTLLRLRAGVMKAGSDAKRQSALMQDSLSSLMVIFRGFMRLHGELPPRDTHLVAEFVAKRASFDVTAFARVIALGREGRAIPAADTEPTLDAYVAGMEALVAYLDAYHLPAQG